MTIVVESQRNIELHGVVARSWSVGQNIKNQKLKENFPELLKKGPTVETVHENKKIKIRYFVIYVGLFD